MTRALFSRAKVTYRENKEWESFSRQKSDYQGNFLITSHGHTITDAFTDTDKERKGVSPKKFLL
jgi:hypothetical protein